MKIDLPWLAGTYATPAAIEGVARFYAMRQGEASSKSVDNYFANHPDAAQSASDAIQGWAENAQRFIDSASETMRQYVADESSGPQTDTNGSELQPQADGESPIAELATQEPAAAAVGASVANDNVASSTDQPAPATSPPASNEIAPPAQEAPAPETPPAAANDNVSTDTST